LKHSDADSNSYGGGVAVQRWGGGSVDSGLFDGCGTECATLYTSPSPEKITYIISRGSGATEDGAKPLPKKEHEVKKNVGKIGLVSAGSAAKHLVWTKGWFKKYCEGQRREHAVCTLCIANKSWETAEVKIRYEEVHH